MTTTGTTGRRRGRTVAAVTAAIGVLAAASAWHALAAGPTRIAGPAVATAVATRVTLAAPPTSAPTSAHFTTLPPGSALPSDAACAAAVRPTPELRADNATANATRGTAVNASYPRVTGNFTGTTDEILQWAACKWGIDEDIVRAQIAKESSWHQSAGGDQTSNQSLCLPAVRTGSGTCPESLGLGQVRFQYHGTAFAEDLAGRASAFHSSAYNVDYTYAVWRACYEGELDWLNTVERGATYVAGDEWGCLGVWFSGRWRTSAALTYVAAVQQYLADRIWEQGYFRTW